MGSVERRQPQNGQGSALPPWSTPPDNVVPGAVALQAVVAASSRAVVVVSILWACPVGFWYGLSIRLREPQSHGIPEIGPFFKPHGRDLESGSPLYGAGEQFHFTLAFADGRTLGSRDWSRHHRPPTQSPMVESPIESCVGG